MKKSKKKLITIFAACMFAMMMMLNVSTTINGTNFSIDGYTSVVCGSTGSCANICIGGKVNCGTNCKQP
jgi:hypothetical protein